ncbi:MAG: tetratricopeptide repeat protein [Pseudomonadota bacterium]
MATGRNVPGSPPLTADQSRQLDVALTHFKRGAYDHALALVQPLTERAPHLVNALHLTALCLVQMGETSRAERYFQRALVQAPRDAHLLANYATFLRKQGRLREAVSLWNRSVQVAPDHFQAWLDMGLTELESGRTSQARAALEHAVALQPASAVAWNGLGAAYRGSGALEEAEAALRRAVELDPGLSTAWISLGAVSRMLGKSARALECYGRARQLGDTRPELLDALAGALLDLGRVDEAIAHAREVTSRFPEFVPGHLTLAHLLWEYGGEGSANTSLDVFEESVRAQPKNQLLRESYVAFLIKARQAERALEWISSLRAQSGDSALLRRLEADALMEVGRYDQSGPLYERLIRADGSRDPSLLNAFTRYLLRAGQWESAAEQALKATSLDPDNQEAWAYLGTAWRLLEDPREEWLCDYERLVGMVEVEPPSGYADLDEFLDALVVALAPLHRAVREPVEQSLRGGSQTSGRLFGRPDPVIGAAETALRRAVESWLARLPADLEHPFLRHAACSIRFTGSWSVKLWSTGRHVNHIHPEGWLSSAFYVALPPSVRRPLLVGDIPAGYIQFGQPPAELELNLAPRRVIQPQRGRLVLFPSYLWHGTVPFHDDEPRITIAFDMTPWHGGG